MFSRSIIILPVLFLFSCDTQPGAQETTAAPTTTAEFVYEADSKNIGPVFIDMTSEQVKSLGLHYKALKENMEGDEYTVFLLNLSGNTIIKCIFDLKNHLSKIIVLSPDIKDSFGNGVGSTLQELQNSYPDGRFIYGTAEGRYTGYLTGSPLIFRFDHKDLPESCFETGKECDIPKYIRVRSFEIGRYSHK